MYKGICKYNSSIFRDETSNMAKFSQLKETSFTTDEMCLSIDLSGKKIIPRFFVDLLGEIVFKLRLMLTGTLIFFFVKQEIFGLSGYTDSLFPII